MFGLGEGGIFFWLGGGGSNFRGDNLSGESFGGNIFELGKRDTVVEDDPFSSLDESSFEVGGSSVLDSIILGFVVLVCLALSNLLTIL